MWKPLVVQKHNGINLEDDVAEALINSLGNFGVYLKYCQLCLDFGIITHKHVRRKVHILLKLKFF